MSDGEEEMKNTTKTKIIIALIAMLIAGIAFVATNFTMNIASSAAKYENNSTPEQIVPSVENHILQSTDPQIIGFSPKTLKQVDDNFLDYGFLLVDKDMLNGATTIDEVWNSENQGQAVFANYRYAASLFDPGNESEYYLAFDNSNIINNSNVTLMDASDFFEYNTNAERVEGIIYDKENGIAYIPKSLYYNEKGEKIQHRIQHQLMFAVSLTDQIKTQISINNEATNVTVPNKYTVATTSPLDSEIMFQIATPDTAANVESDKIEVAINDAVLNLKEGSGYTYDSDTGILRISANPLTVSSVEISIGTSGYFKQNKANATWPGDMNTITWCGKAELKSGVGVGSSIDYWTTVWSDNGGWSHGDDLADGNYHTYYPGAGSDESDYLAWAIFNNGGIDWGDLSPAAYQGGVVTFALCTPPSNNDLYSGLSSTDLPATCSHYDMGWSPNDGLYYNGSGSRLVRARILNINEDAGYFVLGMVIFELNGQSGTCVAKFPIQNKVEIQVNKISKSDSNVSLNAQHYSLRNARYGIYSDQACTNKIGTIITDSNGKGSAKIKTGTRAFVKEEKPSQGYKLDSTVYPINNGAVLRAGGETYSITSPEEAEKATINYYVDGVLQSSLKQEVYFGPYSHNTAGDRAPYNKGIYDYSGSYGQWYTDKACTQLWVDGTHVTGNMNLYAYNTVNVSFYVDEETTPCYVVNASGTARNRAKGWSYNQFFSSSPSSNAALAAADKAGNKGFGNGDSLFFRWFTEQQYSNKFVGTNLTRNIKLYGYNNVSVTFYADYGPTWNYKSINLGDAGAADPRSYNITTVKYGYAPTAADVQNAVDKCTRDYCEEFKHWYRGHDKAFTYSDGISDQQITQTKLYQNTNYFGYNIVKVDFAYTDQANNLITKYGLYRSSMNLTDIENSRYLYQYRNVISQIDPTTYLPVPVYYLYGQVFTTPPSSEINYYIDANLVRLFEKTSWLNKNNAILNGKQLTSNCTAYMNLDKWGYDGVVGG